MRTRFLTSLGIVFVLAIAFILKFYVSNYFFDILVLAISVVSAYEASKLLTKMGKYNDKVMSVIFPPCLMLMFLLGIYADSSIGLLFTLIFAVALLVIFTVVTFLIPLVNYKNTVSELKTRKLDKQMGVTKFSLTRALNTALVFVYPTFLITFLTLINHFEDFSTTFTSLSGFSGYISLFVLLIAFLIPIFTDTFAYITGGIFYGKKLAPKVSPKKTISGAIGGFLWCILLSVVGFSIFNAFPEMAAMFASAGINVWKIVLISAIGSILSQLGDLVESYLKRCAGVKDSGSFLPGHGGMLDRFDSYVFVAPFIFIAFSIIFALL